MPKTGIQGVTVNLKLKDEGFKKQLAALREYLENFGDLHKDLGRRLRMLSHQAERVDELFEIKTGTNREK
ncbi:unnamed protein product [marine sediment metagenome]|uniref:Uncharacterized protein n=1 Tax=marine sediment metagenome TaxID=412755 RepID=X1H2Z1_9ZZZZ